MLKDHYNIGNNNLLLPIYEVYVAFNNTIGKSKKHKKMEFITFRVIEKMLPNFSVDPKMHDSTLLL